MDSVFCDVHVSNEGGWEVVVEVAGELVKGGLGGLGFIMMMTLLRHILSFPIVAMTIHMMTDWGRG